MSLPCPIITVLAHFEPLFTAPTWKKAVILLVGTLLAQGRRTVTVALRQMDPHLSGFHQVLNRARWSPLAVSRRLLQLLVHTFVGAGGTLEIVMDETLERRWGRKISKRGHWRDSLHGSQEAVGEYKWLTVGHHGVGSELALDAHDSGRCPTSRVLSTTPKVSQGLKRRHKTLAHLAQQMVILVRRWFPDVAIPRDRGWGLQCD